MSVRRVTRRPRADGDEGQAMVEFALVLPIILLLLFGMLQVALVLNARQTVAYAAEAAANSYAQTLARSSGTTAADSAAGQLRPDFAKVGTVEYTLVSGGKETVIAKDGVGSFGDLVVAHATYQYPSPIRAGLGGFHFPETISITAESVARIEAAGSAAGGALPAGARPSPAPAATPTATPAPTSRPSSTPSPTPTPTPGPTFARCFAYSGATVDLATARIVAVQGDTFAPGTTHLITVQYSTTVTVWQQRYHYVGGWFGGYYARYWVPVTQQRTVLTNVAVTAPSTGAVRVGQQSSMTVPVGSGSVTVHLTGTSGGC